MEHNGATIYHWWSTPWILYTLAGGILFVLYIAHKTLVSAIDVLSLVAFSSIAAIIYAIWRYHPRPRWAWIAVVTALMLFLVGGYLNFTDHTMGNLTATRPLTPDLVTIPGYVILAVGLLGLTRRDAPDSPMKSVDALLDGTLVGLSVTILVFATLIGPRLAAVHAPLRTQIIISTYPGLSALLLIVLIRLAITTGSRATAPYILLVLTFTAMVIGDILYMLVDARIATINAVSLDAPYFIAYLFAGSCALNPLMAKISMPRYSEGTLYRIIQGVFITVALSVPAATLLTDHQGTHTSRVTTLVMMFALAIVVAFRIIRALHAATATQDRLSHLALHDPLTGLPNRHFLAENLSLSEKTALIFIDLDQFKLINDAFGHAPGDTLLIEVANRLRNAVHRGDMVARLSGDEFLVIISDVTSMEQARQVADELRQSLRQPFQGPKGPLFVTGSFGIALSDSSSPLDLDTLLIHSDMAMYEAKRNGRDTVISYTLALGTSTVERLALKNDLRLAIERDQIYCAYQPVVNAKTGDLSGVEALARWTHPSLGVRSPESFIPLAEETGNILQLGANVMRHALSGFSDLIRKGLIPAGAYVAVNVSPIQLNSPELVPMIESCLIEFHLEPASLCVELTETAAMTRPVTESGTLGRLRDLGIRLAIDDFGTGYSSLAYLSRLPINILKIDKTFVTPNPQNRPILTAIIAMAQSLGLATTAEGIETEEQRILLSGLGVGSLQGYLMSKPVAIDTLAALLRSPDRTLARQWVPQKPAESPRQQLAHRSP